jgi:RHH-type rel operon transcriptional repressor/antitoxin RelB
MDPLLERELERAAKRKGITKSQFIIEAVERSLGRKNPYELMVALKAEESRPEYQAVSKAFEGYEQPYDTDASRAQLLEKLKAKHGGSAG